MNLSSAAIVFRPRSISELFDLACRFATGKAFVPLFKLSLWLLLPGWLLMCGLRLGFGWPWEAVWPLSVVWALGVQGPFTVCIGQLIFSGNAGAAPSIREALSRFWPTLATSLFFWVCLAFVGWTVLLIPVVYARFLFLNEVVLLEGQDTGNALKRTGSISKFHMGQLMGFSLALIVCRLAAVGVVESLGQALVGSVLQLGAPLGNLYTEGGSAFALLGLFVSTPFIALARFLQYVDLRTRSEGWDIQVRFMSLTEAQRKGAA